MNDGEISANDISSGKPILVRWKNGVITDIDTTNFAADGRWIAPTLFDLQINGYGGIDFQQDGLTCDDLLSATRQLRRDGCARYFLTLITEDWARLTARLRHLKELRSQSGELQDAIAGWHIEGPFLSEKPGFHGAHNPAFMHDPQPAQIRELRDITETDPLLLTLSPERNGSHRRHRAGEDFGDHGQPRSHECLRGSFARRG